MRKGFTLLELIVVIIILGVLATLATTQYSKMIEKARGAEARVILGSIRTNAAAYYMQHEGNCTSMTNAYVGIGSDYPSSCAQGTHYFRYSIAPSAKGFTGTATRCSVSGKTPSGTAASTIQLATDFSTGGDTWTYVAPY